MDHVSIVLGAVLTQNKKTVPAPKSLLSEKQFGNLLDERHHTEAFIPLSMDTSTRHYSPWKLCGCNLSFCTCGTLQRK